MPLPERVLKFARERKLFEKGEKVVVAVSGGPDSVALLDILYRLRGDLDISLLVAHLNHKIRPGEAEEDARFVKGLAEGYGLPFVYGEEDVPRLASEEGMSIEEAAREARYNFLRRVAEEQGAAKVALGHNRDDVVETVLLNIIRGTGPDGLAGMSPVREGIFVRPLLCCSREEIERYCQERGLSWRLDSSNLDTAYTRNRIRHVLLPLLEREFSPRIRERLLRLAELAGLDSEALNEAARRMVLSAASVAEGKVALPLALIESAPEHLKGRIVRQAYLLTMGTLRDLDHVHVKAVLSLLRSPPGSQVCLPGAVARRSYNFLTIERGGRGLPEPTPFEVQIPIPGEAEIPEAGARIEAVLTSRKGIPEPPKSPDPFVAFFDASLVEPPLVARSFRPGDRIRVHGLGGTKKVHDVFVDEKVPRERRKRLPLICDRGGERVLWIPGVARSEHALVAPETSEVLILRVKMT